MTNLEKAVRRIERAKRINATRLDLSGLKLEVLPESIVELSALETLNLFSNRLTALPHGFERLSALKRLNLSMNQLTSLPDSFGNLVELESLEISQNQLSTLPDSFGQLTGLQSLDLSINRLNSLPESFGQLEALRELSIHRNRLAELPNSFGRLTSLQELSLYNIRLTSLPESFSHLSELRIFDVSNNRLTSLPEPFGQLASLQVLNLSGNKLTSLPESFGQLAALQELILSSNELTVLPKTFGQLPALKTLYLYRNGLKRLPDSFGQLSTLQKLDLFDNRLTSLPQDFSNLAALQWLSLHKNRLKNLPDSFGRLASLQSLILSDNQLAALPESFADLAGLDWLSLENNRLAMLPDSLERWLQPERLFLHGNEKLRLPPEILGPTPEELHDGAHPVHSAEILDYYFRLRRGVSRQLNEARLILVGPAQAGKTSLINRLIHDTFNEKEEETLGIRMEPWEITLRDEEIRLNTWDFGGGEIIRATHQFFLTKRSLYLLVLSGGDGNEDEEAAYWLKLIQCFGEKSSVIVVLNKTGQYRSTLNRSRFEQEYHSIREFIETDCAANTGIAELRRAIERETDRLPGIREEIPRSWLAVRNQLSKMEGGFVSKEEFRAACAANGIQGTENRTQLAEILHILGVALNYANDARLNETNILDPRWVTNGFSSIINSPTVARHEGRFEMKDLAHFLDPERYPAHLHRFLVELMQKFEICLPVVEQPGHYLLPGLLTPEESKRASEFNPEECLNFRYEYPIRLVGLLPRFIVRTHALSCETSRWRSGVILMLEGAEALVRTRGLTVDIMAKGSISARRQLLSIIRSEFKRIHLQFKRLNVQELVPLPKFPGKNISYQSLLIRVRNGREIYRFEDGGMTHSINVRELLEALDAELQTREPGGRQ